MGFRFFSCSFQIIYPEVMLVLVVAADIGHPVLLLPYIDFASANDFFDVYELIGLFIAEADL